MWARKMIDPKDDPGAVTECIYYVPCDKCGCDVKIIGDKVIGGFSVLSFPAMTPAVRCDKCGQRFPPIAGGLIGPDGQIEAIEYAWAPMADNGS